jgi:FkbM family methyltransferase
MIRSLVRRLVPRAVRNWLRSPRRSLTWVWDEARYRGGLRPALRLRPGWRLVCHPTAHRAIQRPQLADSIQIAELDGFIATCRPGMVLFDLGAHFGMFSFAALHFGGPTSRAVAVDPSAEAVRMLRLGGRLNAVADRLHVVHAAAGERPGWLDMLPVGVIADGYYVTPEPDRAASELVRVRAVTVDGLVHELGVRPTHLKIDVEGAEAAVLRGARAALGADPPPLVFLELHNDMTRRAGADPAAAVSELTALGYGFTIPQGASITAEAATVPAIVRVIARRGDGAS